MPATRLASLFRKLRSPARPARRTRLMLERLEDRLTPTLIPVTNHRDLVYDAVHNLLDITTSDGKVQRWDVNISSLLSAYNVGTSLYGADIAPDGSLYATEGQTGNGQGTIHKVNLATGAVTNLNYTLASGEAGSFGLAIGSNGKALFDGALGSGGFTVPLHQIDLTTGNITTRTDDPGLGGQVDGSTVVRRGGDRSLLFFTQANDGSGPVFTYGAAADAFSHPAVNTNFTLTNRITAVNRNGTLVAVEMYNGAVSVLDASLHVVKNLPAIDGGVVFDPTQDVLYGVSSANSLVVAFDTNTWAVKFTAPVGEPVTWQNNYGNPSVGYFDSGVMTVSPDDHYLFLATPSGVQEIHLPPANGVASVLVPGPVFPAYIETGVPGTFTITAKDFAGNVVTNFSDTVGFSSTDPQAMLPAPYTFTAADHGTHTFTATLKAVGNQGISVTDLNHPFGVGMGPFVVHPPAPTALLPVSDRRDLVYDSTRNLLYITTGHGTVERYDPVNQALLSPFQVGVSLLGADITPDGKYLFAADKQRGATQGVIHRVDLSTGAVTEITYTIGSGEAGSYSVAVAASGKAFFDSLVEGTGAVPLRQIDLTTGAVTNRTDAGTGGQIAQSTLISRGADGGRAFFTEANISSGPAFTYTAAGDAFSHETNTNMFLSTRWSAVNRNDTLIALEMFNSDVTILDVNLKHVKDLGGIDGGVAFDPTQDVLYGVNSTTGQVVAYDTNTWAVKYTLPVGEPVNWMGGDGGPLSAYGAGIMTVSSDGKFLFLNTASGVRVYALPQASGVAASLQVGGFPAYVKAGVAGTVTVTTKDPAGNVVAGYTGTVHFSSSDTAAGLPADYTFNAGDNGSHTFTLTLNTASTTAQSVTVTDSAHGLSGGQANITVHSDVTSLIPVLTHEGLVYDSTRNLLYITSSNGTVQRYDVAHQTLLAPLQVGVSLLGADITPDGRFLYVTDNQRGATQGVIHKVDLTTGAVTDLAYDINSSSYLNSIGASYAVAVAGSGKIFATAQFEGSGGATPIFQIDPTTGALSVRTEASQNTGIVRGGDRSLLLLSVPNGANEPVFTYSTAGDVFSGAHNTGLGLGSMQSAVNRNGTLLALVANNGNTLVLDTNFNTVVTLPGVDTSVAFDPTRDVLYGVSSSNNTITAYSTSNWGTLFSMPVGEKVTPPTNIGPGSVFGTDVMTVSADGSSLFLNTASGVRVYALTAGSHLVVSGFPSPVTAGTSNSITVTAEDANGHVLTGYSGTVHFSSSDHQATLPADYTFTPADAGMHTFGNLVTLRTAGTQSITAQDLGNPTIGGTQGNITVNPAAAIAFSVSGYPASVTAGTAQNLTVTAVDVYGNLATGYTGTVHITSSDPQASLPADHTLSGGTGTFAVTLKTAGSQAITATDTVTTSITGNQPGITVSPAAAASLALSGLPSAVTAGTAANVTVTLKDAYGNLAAGYRGTVHFSSTDPHAALPADYAFTAADAGAHTFTNLVTLKTAGSQAVTATDTASGSLSGNQPGITVSPAAASQLLVTTQPPATVLAGAGFGLTVTAEDPYGNVATGFSGGVALALASNPGGATLGGTTSTSASQGVAAFSGLTLDKAGVGYTIQATSASLTSATTNAITVSSLGLSSTSVTEFRPVGTPVGTLSTQEPGSGHTFTYTLVSGAGSTDNASFTVSGNQLLTADAFDSAAKSSYGVRVRSTDEANNTVEAAFTITVSPDPNLRRTGRTLAVSGPRPNNTFTFAAGAVRHALTLNGVALAVDAASVDAVTFSGNGGSDTATLVAVGTGNIAALMPTGATLQGSGYSVSVGGAAQVSVYGGSGDSAYFTDSPGVDTFQATPAYATQAGSGYSATASGFGYVHATSTGGADRAYLYDTAGGASFLATPTYAYLAGAVFTNVVAGFPTVISIASAGADSAYLYGSPAGGGVLIGTPTYSYFYGSGFFNEAAGYARVVGTAGAASDLAYLYGAAAGGNVFVGTPNYGYLTGASYFDDAVGFQKVTATAGAGSDNAYLYGAPGNIMVATSANAYLYGSGYFNDASGFHSVYGYSGYAGLAYLLGTGTSADTYVNAGSYAYLYGDLFFELASGFASVYANPNARR
jgi:hypothetical protein